MKSALGIRMISPISSHIPINLFLSKCQGLFSYYSWLLATWNGFVCVYMYRTFFILLKKQKTNGMLQQGFSKAVIIISLQTHIKPVLVKMPVLLSRRRREALFVGEPLFNKWWLLLDLWAELDLRSTEQISALKKYDSKCLLRWRPLKAPPANPRAQLFSVL